MFLYPSKPMESYLRSLRLKEWKGWCVEPKWDGWRILLVAGQKGRAGIYTRQGRKIDEVITHLRAGTILDGELLGPRHKGENGKRLIYLFDVLAYEDDILSEIDFADRRKILESIMRTDAVFGRYKFRLAQQYKVKNKIELNMLYLRLTEDKFVEGVVLKRLDSKLCASITTSKQNPGWIKIKR